MGPKTFRGEETPENSSQLTKYPMQKRLVVVHCITIIQLAFLVTNLKLLVLCEEGRSRI
jgi:hypothetical protein